MITTQRDILKAERLALKLHRYCKAHNISVLTSMSANAGHGHMSAFNPHQDPHKLHVLHGLTVNIAGLLHILNERKDKQTTMLTFVTALADAYDQAADDLG